MLRIRSIAPNFGAAKGPAPPLPWSCWASPLSTPRPCSRDSSWQPPLFLPPEPDGQQDGDSASSSCSSPCPAGDRCRARGTASSSLTLQRKGGLGTGCKKDNASPSSVMVEETPGGGWDRGVGGRWCLVDVMPCGGELDEGRKDGGVGEMVFSIPDFCWS